jgi:hypothetical protein
MRGIAPFQGNLELSTNLTERLRPRGERQIRVRGAVQIENGASNSFWLDSFPTSLLDCALGTLSSMPNKSGQTLSSNHSHSVQVSSDSTNSHMSDTNSRMTDIATRQVALSITDIRTSPTTH